MTKQAYHKGTVLIQCPGCKARHLIADNLKIFGSTDVNVEDILRARGEAVQRGSVSDGGDVEFVQDEHGGIRLAIEGKEMTGS